MRTALAWLIVGAAAACAPSPSHAAELPRKPNIVFILTDDPD